MVIPVAQLTGSPVWSDGEPFDGYVLLAVVPPPSSSEIRLNNRITPDHTMPLRIKVAVKDGVFDRNVKIPFNSAYEPPNTKYCAFWLDNQDNVLVSPADQNDFFTIEATPYAINLPTLTAPAAGTSVPVLG